MTTITERKSGSRCRCERRKPLFCGLAIGFESLSRFKRRSFGSPQSLSAGFGLGPAPSQTQQKSGSQSSDGFRRQFAATPPARKAFTFRFSRERRRALGYMLFLAVVQFTNIMDLMVMILLGPQPLRKSPAE